MQKRTSANTSINSSKLPAVYTKHGIKGNIFDYGCGKHTAHIEKYVNDNGFKWFGYDPFNRTENENNAAMQNINNIDYVYCSNVLNVIDSDSVLFSVCSDLASYAADRNKTVVITVYEGNKSGIGRETKADCWQRNQKLNTYLKYFNGYDCKTTVSKGCIILTPNEK